MWKKTVFWVVTGIVITIFVFIGLYSYSITEKLKEHSNNQEEYTAEIIRLKEELEFERGKNFQQDEEIREYIETIYTLKYYNDNPEKAVTELQEKLSAAEILAGLTTLEGEGIEVKMDDSRGQEILGSPVYESTVHDTYLMQIINELRCAGAEAISINDERILSTSEIRCVGNVILVNTQRLSAPYTIKAIGNSETISSGLEMKGGIADVLTQKGITLEIQKLSNVIIEKYDGEIKMDYAKGIGN